jgi:acyl-CoA synthetase (AMP-forming)/AMP-acid ligase II
MTMLPTEAQTVPDLVAAAATAFGDKPAVVDGDTTLSFAALADAALQAGRAFIAAGLRHGDRVAVWAPNLHEWIVAALGLQTVGGVLVPLNTRLKGGEAGYILEKSGARMLFTMDEFLGARYVDLLTAALGAGDGTPIAGLASLERIVVFRGDGERRPGVQSWNDFLDGAGSVAEAAVRERAAAVSADDLSDILFTSGTTGKPKGVMTAHGQNLRAFEVWTDVVGLREDDRYLVVNPFFHSFGYKAGWLSCLMRGAVCLPQSVFDVPQVLERIGRDRVTMLPGPPTLYQTILSHPERDTYDLSSLRLAVTGAAVVPVELIVAMREVLRFDTVITGYGLTECCGIVTMCRHDDDPETIATTSGKAIPGVEVRCVDLEGSEVARGEPGEVVTRGYNVMRGYFDDDSATAETIDEGGWLHTGDIGVMNERGYLRITDRIKDMFIIGGFNCYPAEIETILNGHPDIASVAVVGVPDDRMGEVGMAFVVAKRGVSVDEKAVVAWCRENMANYKVPRHIAVLGELPTNAMGKVTKFVLREKAAELLAATTRSGAK